MRSYHTENKTLRNFPNWTSPVQVEVCEVLDVILDIPIQGFPVGEDEDLVNEFLVGAGFEEAPEETDLFLKISNKGGRGRHNV